MTSADNFDNAISTWVAELEQPWNKLRYTLYRANLKRHLPSGSLRILDVGGGSGSDAIPLAQEGHEVALVDFSTKMLEQAQQMAQHCGVSDRLVFYEADLFDLPELFSAPTFDVVMCHNVIHYVEDMPGALRAICSPLKPGGIVSVINVNRASDVLQAALLRLDLDEAYERIDAHDSYSPIFQTSLHRYIGEEMIGPLQDAGCTPLGHYGIRCMTDYIFDNTLKHDPEFYAKLEKLELALTDKLPYVLIARFFQLIAQKQES
jgi:S-adenosylmethionine-dependent methyltransferase